MSEPSPPPPTPQPFAPAPMTPGAGGCGKPALVGCGLLLLLLGIAGIVFVVKARDLLAWSLDRVRQGVLANLPPDVTPADRERFDVAFAAASRGVKSGKVDQAALQRLQRELMRAVQKPQGALTRADFVALTEALEKLGGVAPPAESPPAEAPPAESKPPVPPASLPASPPSTSRVLV